MNSGNDNKERPPLIKRGVGVSQVLRRKLNDRICADNLRALLIVLGWIVNYEFDSSDWNNVSAGVQESNSSHERWFEYELVGTHSARLRLARSEMNDILIHADVSTELLPQARLALDIFSTFKVDAAHGQNEK